MNFIIGCVLSSIVAVGMFGLIVNTYPVEAAGYNGDCRAVYICHEDKNKLACVKRTVKVYKF